MKALLALVLALCLAGGLFVFMTAGSSVQTVRAVQPDVARPGSSLDQRVAGIERTLEQIVSRLDAIEMRSQLATVLPAGESSSRSPLSSDSSGEELAFDDALRGLAAALENPDIATSPELENLIVAVVEGREEQADAQRREERRQALEDQVNERMLELRHELGLDDVQAEGLRGLLVTQRERRDEVFDTMRAGGVPDRRLVRTEMRTIRDEFNTGVQLVLAPAQYDRFVELEQTGSDFGGFGPPQGRRGTEDQANGRDGRN